VIGIAGKTAMGVKAGSGIRQLPQQPMRSSGIPCGSAVPKMARATPTILIIYEPSMEKIAENP
jgi:hypothetical protein